MADIWIKKVPRDTTADVVEIAPKYEMWFYGEGDVFIDRSTVAELDEEEEHTTLTLLDGTQYHLLNPIMDVHGALYR